MQIGKFIGIYGIDGTGKTTTTEELHRKLIGLKRKSINFDTYKDSSTYPINPYRKKESGSREEQCSSYFQSMSHHSEQIRKLVLEGYTVIKSRYLRDIRAHFSHLGIPESFLDECEENGNFIFPDIDVILKLEESLRRKRLLERGELDERDKDYLREGTRAKFFQDYILGYPSGNHTVIDTGENSTNAVVNTILAFEKVIL